MNYLRLALFVLMSLLAGIASDQDSRSNQTKLPDMSKGAIISGRITQDKTSFVVIGRRMLVKKFNQLGR